MKFRFKVAMTVAVSLALVSVACADILIDDLLRFNTVTVLDYDFETIDELSDWSFETGDFESSLTANTQSVAISDQVSTLIVEGNSLQLSGQLVCQISREDPTSFERVFVETFVELEFTVSENSTMSIANPVMSGIAQGVTTYFVVSDRTTDDQLVFQTEGGLETVLSLEAGHQYYIYIRSYCSYIGEDAVDHDAEVDFSVTVEPSDPVATDVATWSKVKAIFQ